MTTEHQYFKRRAVKSIRCYAFVPGQSRKICSATSDIGYSWSTRHGDVDKNWKTYRKTQYKTA